MSKTKSSVIEAATREAEAVKQLSVRKIQEQLLARLAPQVEKKVMEALANPNSGSAALETVAAQMVKEAAEALGGVETAQVNFSIEPGAELDVHVPANQAVEDLGGEELFTAPDAAFGPADDGLFGDEPDMSVDMGGSDEEPEGDEDDLDLDDLLGDEGDEGDEGGEEEPLEDSLDLKLRRKAVKEAANRKVAIAALKANARRARVLSEWVSRANTQEEIARGLKACAVLGKRITESTSQFNVNPTKDREVRPTYEQTIKSVNELFQAVKRRRKTLAEANGGNKMANRINEEEDFLAGLDDFDMGDEFGAPEAAPEAPEMDALPEEASDPVEKALEVVQDLEETLEDVEEELLALLGGDEGEEDDDADDDDEASETNESQARKEAMMKDRIRARKLAEARKRAAIRRRQVALPEGRRRKRAAIRRRQVALAEGRRRKAGGADERRRAVIAEVRRRAAARRRRAFEGMEEGETAALALGGEFDAELPPMDGPVDQDDRMDRERARAREEQESRDIRDVRPRPNDQKAALRGQLKEARRQLASEKLNSAKALLAAKIAANENLTKAKKQAAVEAIDRAKSLNEVKAAYRAIRVTLSEAFEPAKSGEYRAALVNEARRRLARRAARRRLEESRNSRRPARRPQTSGSNMSSESVWRKIAFGGETAKK